MALRLSAKFCTSFAALATLLACMSTSEAMTVSCSSGAQLVAAMAGTNPVSAVLLGNRIVLRDSDWLGYRLPVLIGHDFLITGLPGQAITFDMNFVRGKVQMANGTALVFQNLVLVNYLSGSWNQAPGLNLLVPTRENETAIVRMENTAIIFRFCFPLLIAQESTRNHLVRPSQIPGNQSYVLPEQQPANCSNSTSAPALERCYVYMGRYVDVAAPELDMLSSGRLGLSGYLIHCLNTLGLCQDVYPAECIDRLGPIGCVLDTLSLSTPPPTPEGFLRDASEPLAPPPALLATLRDRAGGGGGGGGPHSQRRLSVILGSVLGAVVAAVGAAVLLRAVVRRRTRRDHTVGRWRRHRGGGSKDVADEAPAAAVGAGKQACNSQGNTEQCSYSGSPWSTLPVVDPKQLNDGAIESCGGSCGPGCEAVLSSDSPSLLRYMVGGAVALPAVGPAANWDGGLPTDGDKLAAVNAEGRRAHGRGEALERAMTPGTTAAAAGAALSVITPATHHRADLHMDIRLATSATPTPGVCRRSYGSTTLGNALTTNPAAVVAAAAGDAAGAAADPGADAGACAGAAEAGCSVVTLLPVMLGKGAFGRVYEGIFQGSRVAVKVLLESVFDVLAETSFTLSQQLPRPPPPPQQQQQQQPEHQTPEQQRVLLQRRRQQAPQEGDQEGDGQQPGQQTTDRAGPALVVVDGSGGNCADHIRPTQDAVVRQVSETGSGSGPYDDLARQQEQQGERQAAQAAPSGPSTCESGTLVADVVCPHEGDAAPPLQEATGSQAVPPESDRSERSRRLLRQFAQEVEVMGRGQHPNIVRLLAACLTPPRLCLVMERMETSLQRMIFGGERGSRRALMPLSTVLHIAIQVSRGLEYLHPTIIHRDLKPANVLINGANLLEPVAKISDFGLARIRSATLSTLSSDAGTPAYLAPECYDSASAVITHQADIYALGVLLWVMLTGQEPWTNHSVVAVGVKVAILGQRLPLEQLSDRRCPPKLKQLIWQCWEADPRRRPAAAEMVNGLELLRRELQELHFRLRTDRQPRERHSSSAAAPTPPHVEAAVAALEAEADSGMPRRLSCDSPKMPGGVDADRGASLSPRAEAFARRCSLGDLAAGADGASGGGDGGCVEVLIDIDGFGGAAAGAVYDAGEVTPSSGADVSGTRGVPLTITVTTARAAATAVTATGPAGCVGAATAGGKPSAAAGSLRTTPAAAAAAGHPPPGAIATASLSNTAGATGASASPALTGELDPLSGKTVYGETGVDGNASYNDSITALWSRHDLLRQMSTMSEGTMQQVLRGIELEIE